MNPSGCRPAGAPFIQGPRLESLKCIEIVNGKTAREQTIETPVFSFIGRRRKPAGFRRKSNGKPGFSYSGSAVARSTDWTAPRTPYLLETSQPGVFAAGDVRAGSKRVASAVGEGAVSVQFVHEYLKAM
jgi:thioredoxin reductase (NADPH)